VPENLSTNTARTSGTVTVVVVAGTVVVVVGAVVDVVVAVVVVGGKVVVVVGAAVLVAFLVGETVTVVVVAGIVVVVGGTVVVVSGTPASAGATATAVVDTPVNTGDSVRSPPPMVACCVPPAALSPDSHRTPGNAAVTMRMRTTPHRASLLIGSVITIPQNRYETRPGVHSGQPQQALSNGSRREAHFDEVRAMPAPQPP
jgi:hypothetical protein